MPTFQHAIGQGRASCGWGSPLFRVEDEGDGRNDVRVAHTRPIVAKGPVELPSGQMLPRRRDRAGTGRWRSIGGSRSSALPAARSRPCLPPSPIQGKFGLQSGPHYPPYSGGLMGVILQVALPSRELAAARLQCGAAGAGASRGLGVCAEHARLAARGESPRAMEIGDFGGGGDYPR